MIEIHRIIHKAWRAITDEIIEIQVGAEHASVFRIRRGIAGVVDRCKAEVKRIVRPLRAGRASFDEVVSRRERWKDDDVVKRTDGLGEEGAGNDTRTIAADRE